ncbi:MAG: methylmalonyl-CoA mutase, partial [Solirubrobacterales bacterium]|nr:methylmalonyl-CoA mutase [Solirubrobacterales bacterium]
VQAVKAGRDSADVERTLAAIKQAAVSGANLMPPLIDAARVHVSEGEMIHALQDVWGAYTETPVY